MKGSSSPPIAAIEQNLFLGSMATENETERRGEDLASGNPSNIHDRVKALHEKASRLDDTLARVEKTLEEAADETKP